MLYHNVILKLSNDTTLVWSYSQFLSNYKIQFIEQDTRFAIDLNKKQL